MTIIPQLIQLSMSIIPKSSLLRGYADVPTIRGCVIRGKSLILQSVKMGALREPELLDLEVRTPQNPVL